MREETIKRGFFVLTCGAFLCAAAAAAQEPVKSEKVVPTQTAAAPATGGPRKATNIAPDSEMAKMFSSVDAPIVSAPQGEESAGKSKDGSVKIHGHWLVELKGKDGTVKERREFDNSYVGGYIMGLYLAGFDVPIDPAISFGSANNGPGSVCNGVNSGNYCVIVESLGAGHGAADSSAYGLCSNPNACFSGLTSTLLPSGGPYTSWVLNAAVTVSASGTFDTVFTSISGCYSNGYNSATNVSPSSCYSNAVQYANNTSAPLLINNLFTSTLLPGGAVTVTSGETLVFTVTISFS